MKRHAGAAAPLATGWAPVEWTTWATMIATVAEVRPLTRAEAIADCRARARNGGVPSPAACARAWGWPGEAGVSRARRLVEDVPTWMDSTTREYLAKNRLSPFAPDVEVARARVEAARARRAVG